MVVEFGEPILMRIGLDNDAMEKLINKMIPIRPGWTLYLDPVRTAQLLKEIGMSKRSPNAVQVWKILATLKTSGKLPKDATAVDKADSIHTKMMEFEPLLKASGERNIRSINLTHGDGPCHCIAQTVLYPEKSNLCLIWDVEEIHVKGLPDHQQKVTVFVVSSMLAL